MKNKPLIAVVQDDSMYRTIMQRLLQNSELFFDVLTFDNGLTILSYLKETNRVEKIPDIILLDVNMPIMDGWTFLEQYQSLASTLSKHSHIFTHTASINEEDMQRASQHSCVVGNIPAPLRLKVIQEQFSRYATLE